MPIPARPTIYQGVPMRSRTEATVAAWLDRQQFRWTYEPNAFADSVGQYLPDFRLDGLPSPWFWQPDGVLTPPDWPNRGRSPAPPEATVPWYVEVKPESFDLKAVKLQMETIWSSDLTAVLLIISPGFRTLDWPLGEAGAWADHTMVYTCAVCSLTSIVSDTGGWLCIRCGGGDGDHHIGSTPSGPLWYP